jgi:hypothetical protein
MSMLALDDEGLIAQCEVDHYRASGPGGQKRNKTSSAVRLRHRPTGVAVVAVEDRSQHVNKRRAVRRLREAIALNVREPVDISRYRPSELLALCLGRDGSLQIGAKDPRRYQVIRELLDVLAACGMSVRDAAALVGMSTAQLVKLIQADDKLWARVNQLRAAAGIKPLR